METLTVSGGDPFMHGPYIYKEVSDCLRDVRCSAWECSLREVPVC